LTKSIIHKHDHLTAAENVLVPTPQARHPSVSGFGLPEETFVLVIGPRHMRMVITRKQTFPKPACVGHEIGYERLVVFVDIRFLDPVQ
jgi:hypothetical protein